MPTQNRQGAPDTQPGKEGKARGTGPAVEEARELHTQCLRRHSHIIIINCTLDSLNNVDRPHLGPLCHAPSSTQEPGPLPQGVRLEVWPGAGVGATGVMGQGMGQGGGRRPPPPPTSLQLQRPRQWVHCHPWARPTAPTVPLGLLLSLTWFSDGTEGRRQEGEEGEATPSGYAAGRAVGRGQPRGVQERTQYVPLGSGSGGPIQGSPAHPTPMQALGGGVLGVLEATGLQGSRCVVLRAKGWSSDQGLDRVGRQRETD